MSLPGVCPLSARRPVSLTMLRYVGRRLLGALPVLWGVATLVFVVMRLLPGDPAALMLSEAGGSVEAIASLRASLGFDDPLIVQYGRYFLGVPQSIGHIDLSLESNRNRSDILRAETTADIFKRIDEVQSTVLVAAR